MRTYWINGIASEEEYILGEESRFAIQTVCEEDERYVYQGDGVLYEISEAIQFLIARCKKSIFGSLERYYFEIEWIPSLITDIGLDSECRLGVQVLKETLEEYEKTHNVEPDKRNLDRYFAYEIAMILKRLPSEYSIDPYKHFYINEILFLVNAVSDLVLGANYNFIEFFRCLGSLDTSLGERLEGDNLVIGGGKVEKLISIVGSYYIKLHSIMDILTKIQFELEHPPTDDRKYIKLKCKDITYGNASRLELDSKGTLFERDEFINEIESIRNEVVHNGTWDYNPRVYVRREEGIVVEKYLKYPDIDNGHFTKCRNRYHFFSQGIRANDRLVSVHFEFLKRLRVTLLRMSYSKVEIDEILKYCEADCEVMKDRLYESFEKKMDEV